MGYAGSGIGGGRIEDGIIRAIHTVMEAAIETKKIKKDPW
jgi:hypothetical protein